MPTGGRWYCLESAPRFVNTPKLELRLEISGNSWCLSFEALVLNLVWKLGGEQPLSKVSRSELLFAAEAINMSKAPFLDVRAALARLTLEGLLLVEKENVNAITE